MDFDIWWLFDNVTLFFLLGCKSLSSLLSFFHFNLLCDIFWRTLFFHLTHAGKIFGEALGIFILLLLNLHWLKDWGEKLIIVDGFLLNQTLSYIEISELKIHVLIPIVSLVKSNSSLVKFTMMFMWMNLNVLISFFQSFSVILFIFFGLLTVRSTFRAALHSGLSHNDWFIIMSLDLHSWSITFSSVE